jgi:hypothetical protein
VIHVSLGTNDDPRDLDGFRAAIAAVMRVAGERRCVVWANIVRPPYRGVSYRGYNHVLGVAAGRRENLRVLNRARMVRRHPGWLGDDGVHVSAEGYRVRAGGTRGAPLRLSAHPALRDAGLECGRRRCRRLYPDWPAIPSGLPAG